MLASIYSTSNWLHRTHLSRFLKADKPGQGRFPAERKSVPAYLGREGRARARISRSERSLKFWP
jgi:hypothetical protein